MKASETEARALCEPSNAEQADWPDATRDYVHGLEAAIEALLADKAKVVAWQPIETAPKNEMILSCADGMVRLVMWGSDCWVQVGATIEPGWYEPTYWQPLADAIERDEHLKETDNG